MPASQRPFTSFRAGLAHYGHIPPKYNPRHIFVWFCVLYLWAVLYSAASVGCDPVLSNDPCEPDYGSASYRPLDRTVED